VRGFALHPHFYTPIKMKLLKFLVIAVAAVPALIVPDKPDVLLVSSHTVDSLGACRGASFLDGKVYLYGDREVGMMREFNPQDRLWRQTERGAPLRPGCFTKSR
jgi:hypothetical protein